MIVDDAAYLWRAIAKYRILNGDWGSIWDDLNGCTFIKSVQNLQECSICLGADVGSNDAVKYDIWLHASDEGTFSRDVIHLKIEVDVFHGDVLEMSELRRL